MPTAPRHSIARRLAPLACLFALAAPATGVTLTVTRFDDPAPDGCFANDCSLREAVILANALAGADTVVLGAGLYQLTRPGSAEDVGLTGDLDSTGPLTLQGAGRTQTTLLGVALGDRLLDARAPIVLADLRLEGGASANAPGGAVLSAQDLTLSRVAVAFNSALVGGAVAQPVFGGTLSATDTIFDGNQADLAGGAIFAEGGAVRLTRCTFTGNSSINSNGGAVALQVALAGTQGLLEIVDSAFSQNSAQTGGAVAIRGGGPTVSDPLATAILRVVRSTFTQNSVAGNGGAISSGRSGPGDLSQRVELSDSAFDSNSSGGAGGALGIEAGSLVADGVDFLQNQASAGGAVSIGPEGPPAMAQIRRSTFTSNHATGLLGGHGGGLIAYGALEVRRSSFVANTATGNGGGVGAGGGTVVARSTFSGNQATGAGGGLWAGDALVQVFSSTFTANMAGSGGNALHGGATIFGNQLRYAGNLISGTCGGGTLAFLSDGGNLESPGSTCVPLGGGPGDLTGVADGALGLAGLTTDGRTWFYLPGAGSVARDRAASACADVDQRGYVAADAACDTGAIEVGATLPTIRDDGFESGTLAAWSAAQGG